MMGNTDLNSAFRKARRFIALLAAFALSFSLLGTASIEAFAATVAGDGEQAGNYTAESTSTDLVYDSVYGVRHGGYALMDKVTDASRGAHRLDLVRGSDNKVTASVAYSENDENDDVDNLIYGLKYNTWVPASDSQGAYVTNLDGQDLLGGDRYDYIDGFPEKDGDVVGVSQAADSTTLTFYMPGATSSFLLDKIGSITINSGLDYFNYDWQVAGGDRYVVLTYSSGGTHYEEYWQLGTNGFSNLSEDLDGIHSLDQTWVWPDGKQGQLVTDASTYKTGYYLDGQLCWEIEADWGWYDGNLGLLNLGTYDGNSSYYNEDGSKAEWADDCYIQAPLGNGKYLVSGETVISGTVYYVASVSSDGSVSKVQLTAVDSSGKRPEGYEVCGNMIFSWEPFGAVYDFNGTPKCVFSDLVGESLYPIYADDEVCVVKGIDDNDATVSYILSYEDSASVVASPKPYLYSLGKSPVDDSPLFAASSDGTNYQVVDKNLNPIVLTANGKSYNSAICTQSEISGLYSSFRNSAIHTSANYNLIYVTENGKYGAVDKDGNIVVPVEYDAYFDSNAEDSNDTILVKKDGKWKFLKLGETETPSEQPGTDPSGEQPGEEPGEQPGDEPSTPGEEPGEQGGTTNTTQTMFRLYNQNSGEHFYTANAGERDMLKGLGWSDEGTGWIAPTSGDKVYRLYNPNAGEHHYTTNASEKNMLVNAGWQYEGVGWYSGGDVRLYREYNPNAYANNHNYTTSKSEHDWLLSLGWKDEGYAWNAVSAS